MGNFIRDFKDGLNGYFEAVKIIRARKLWGYLMIPGVLSLLFGVLIAIAAQAVASNTAGFIAERYPWEFGAEFVRNVSAFLSAAAVFAGALLTYKYVILILVAPFMSPLSEKVEEYLRGQPSDVKFSIPRLVKEVVRGIRISLRNIIREIGYTLLLLILGLFPVIGMLATPLIFVVQAYYAGFGNMDFTLERHMGVRSSAAFVKDYRGLAIANGAVFVLMLMVPVIGLFLAPGLATVAATVETIERLEHESALV